MYAPLFAAIKKENMPNDKAISRFLSIKQFYHNMDFLAIISFSRTANYKMGSFPFGRKEPPV